MTRAVFGSWFIDFDPVCAGNAAGTSQGLDAETAALFPRRLTTSALGTIPLGWGVSNVTSEFHLTMGQSPPGETYNERGEGLPFYQGRTDFGFRFPTPRVFCTAATRLAVAGDTLVSVRAPVGSINMADEPCGVGRGVAAVRSRTGATSFTYCVMASLAGDFARFEADGTVFGSISKPDFERLAILKIPPGIVARFERLAHPLDERIRLLHIEGRTLSALRDAVLPRLLSGALSIRAVQHRAQARV